MQILKASEGNHEDTARARVNATSKSPLGDSAGVSVTGTIAARGSVSDVPLSYRVPMFGEIRMKSLDELCP